MDNHVTLKTARARLDEAGIAYRALDLGGGYIALVAQYGGRLLGPFDGEDGESMLWLSEAFLRADDFAALVGRRAWNLGGERLWINPELKFFCETPETFDATYTVQGALDPGHYFLSESGGGIDLALDATLVVLKSGEEKSFELRRRYAPATSPLAYTKLRNLPVRYCGLTQDVDLRDTSPAHDMAIEPWIVAQINPGGKAVTPLHGAPEFVDYYEPVGGLQRFKVGYAELDITGAHKYKVAYRSAQTIGRMGYVRPVGEKWQLMVRNYLNDPSISYLSEPWGNLGDRGCSTYYYNDDGRTGGFGEFENSLPVVRPGVCGARSISSTSLWFFEGGQADIHAIMALLLGVDYAFGEAGEAK